MPVEPEKLERQPAVPISAGIEASSWGRDLIRILALSAVRGLQTCQKALEPLTRPSIGGAGRGIAPNSKGYFVHESAFVDEGVAIGEGTTIWHLTHIRKNARIGKNCRIGQNVMIGQAVVVGDGVKIQNNVSVYEGVTLEDHVFCGPSMVFTNVFNPRSEIPRIDELRPTLVRRGATLGANCTILCGVTIGTYAFIGAGAVVIRDVPDFALVVGNPARIAGWMCACGERIKLENADGRGACSVCGLGYVKVGSRVRPISASLEREASQS